MLRPRVGGQALEEEARAPRPLRRIHAQAEEERRVVAPDPLQDLRRRIGIGPGFGVADGNLPAVGERSLHPRGIAAVHDHDLVALLGEIPGGGGADDAGAQDEDFHGGI